VPPVNLQKAIIDIAALSEEEQLIMKNLADKRRQYISTELIRLAQGA
jgi:hypothetical protein